MLLYWRFIRLCAHCTTAFAAAAVQECDDSLASQLANTEPVTEPASEPVPAVTPATSAPTAAPATMPSTAAASNTTAAAGGATGSGSSGSGGGSSNSDASSKYDQFHTRQYTVLSLVHYAVGSLLAGVLAGVLTVLCCGGLLSKARLARQRSVVSGATNNSTNNACTCTMMAC
jgi:cobalamin biosynthesis Mg chelatase CobN